MARSMTFRQMACSEVASHIRAALKEINTANYKASEEKLDVNIDGLVSACAEFTRYVLERLESEVEKE